MYDMNRSVSNFAIDPTTAVRFSDYPMIAALTLKPAVDAFYEVAEVKYGYMAFIFFAALFSYAGRVFAATGGMQTASQLHYGRHAMAGTAYFMFLLLSLLGYGGAFNEVFKILSPFILFLLVAPLIDRWFVPVLGVASLLTIFANGLLLPFDYGWTYWGGVKTFKGFYYFKTDLAYSVSFSLLGVAIWQRFRFTMLLFAATLLATAEVVLANSRLNYLIFALIIFFMAFKGGIRPWTIVRYAILVSVVTVLAAVLFGSRKLLDFDYSNIGRFTQGRNRIWDVLIEQGVANYSPLEWAFGKGMFADIILFAENVYSGEAHNAHNEWIHLIITQGVLGSLLYLFLWWTMYRFAQVTPGPKWSKGLAVFAFALVGVQSMTAVVSSFATKTWPLVFVLLAVSTLKRAEEP